MLLVKRKQQQRRKEGTRWILKAVEVWFSKEK
jgi:hypothetical protein